MKNARNLLASCFIVHSSIWNPVYSLPITQGVVGNWQKLDRIWRFRKEGQRQSFAAFTLLACIVSIFWNTRSAADVVEG